MKYIYGVRLEEYAQYEMFGSYKKALEFAKKELISYWKVNENEIEIYESDVTFFVEGKDGLGIVRTIGIRKWSVK